MSSIVPEIRKVSGRALHATRSFCVKVCVDLAVQVGVVGLGLMGHAIAQVAAQKGFTVRIPISAVYGFIQINV
jgi:3-hydroxyacyl-CoA dehydrogenase, NAD binding domain